MLIALPRTKRLLVGVSMMKIVQPNPIKSPISAEDMLAMEHCQQELNIANERMLQFLASLTTQAKPALRVVPHHG